LLLIVNAKRVFLGERGSSLKYELGALLPNMPEPLQAPASSAGGKLLMLLDAQEAMISATLLAIANVMLALSPIFDNSKLVMILKGILLMPNFLFFIFYNQLDVFIFL
jgi:hypothetical protein